MTRGVPRKWMVVEEEKVDVRILKTRTAAIRLWSTVHDLRDRRIRKQDQRHQTKTEQVGFVERWNDVTIQCLMISRDCSVCPFAQITEVPLSYATGCMVPIAVQILLNEGVELRTTVLKNNFDQYGPPELYYRQDST